MTKIETCTILWLFCPVKAIMSTSGPAITCFGPRFSLKCHLGKRFLGRTKALITVRVASQAPDSWEEDGCRGGSVHRNEAQISAHCRLSLKRSPLPVDHLPLNLLPHPFGGSYPWPHFPTVFGVTDQNQGVKLLKLHLSCKPQVHSKNETMVPQFGILVYP